MPAANSPPKPPKSSSGAAEQSRKPGLSIQDVKARVTAAGRSADHCKILPGALVIVGRTSEEAREKKALLDSLVHPESGMPNLSIRLGVDASALISMRHCPKFRRQTRARAGATRSWLWRAERT